MRRLPIIDLDYLVQLLCLVRITYLSRVHGIILSTLDLGCETLQKDNIYPYQGLK